MSFLEWVKSFFKSSEVQQDNKGAEEGAEEGAAVQQGAPYYRIDITLKAAIDSEPGFNTVQTRCMMMQVRDKIFEIADLAGHRYAIFVGPIYDDEGFCVILYTPIVEAKHYIWSELITYYYSDDSYVHTVTGATRIEEEDFYPVKKLFDFDFMTDPLNDPIWKNIQLVPL